jgi:hypothetical protein
MEMTFNPWFRTFSVTKSISVSAHRWRFGIVDEVSDDLRPCERLALEQRDKRDRVAHAPRQSRRRRCELQDLAGKRTHGAIEMPS